MVGSGRESNSWLRGRYEPNIWVRLGLSWIGRRFRGRTAKRKTKKKNVRRNIIERERVFIYL